MVVRRGISFLLAIILALLLIELKELVLEFSERLDPSFSAVWLLDSNNQMVNI